jgi:plastocyanin
MLVGLAACGGDGGNTDSPGEPDAPVGQATVVKVEPCTGEAATVTNNASAYLPAMTTINQGQIVKFVMIDQDHNVVPNPLGPSDPGLEVDFGDTACLRFTQTGTFKFICFNHSFAGTITVQ